MLVAETLRQLTILIAHSMLGVESGVKFVMPALHVGVPEPELGLSGFPKVIIDVSVDELKCRRDGRLKSFRAHATFRSKGRTFAQGRSEAILVDNATYSRLRGGVVARSAVPLSQTGVSPRSVGRAKVADVLLGTPSAGAGWPVIVDTSNPVFFDHPLDHVPSMLLLEAARQAAIVGGHAAPARRVSAIDALFHRMVELGEPAFAQVRGDGRVDISQAGRVVCSFGVSLRSDRR